MLKNAENNSLAKFANFVYFCITSGNPHHFWHESPRHKMKLGTFSDLVATVHEIIRNKIEVQNVKKQSRGLVTSDMPWQQHKHFEIFAWIHLLQLYHHFISFHQ